MKILMTAYMCRPNSGSEASIGWRTPLAVARESEVWLLTPEHNRAKIEAELSREPQPRVHFCYVPLPRIARRWNHHLQYLAWLVASYVAAKRLHREVRFDVAQHVSYVRYWTPPLLALLPTRFVWGPIAGHEPSPLALARGGGAYVREAFRKLVLFGANLNPLLWFTARRSAVTVACSLEMQSHGRLLGARRTRVMIPSPPLEDVFELARTTVDPAPIGEVVQLVSVAGPHRVLDWKGYHLALHGIARSGVKNVRYRIFGSGREEGPLRRLAQELGIEGRVEFVGDVPRREMLLAMRDAVALLHPALHDGGATVIVEAMALGVPTICLDMGGPAVQVSEETGFKVPGTSKEAVAEGIAAAIGRLVSEPDLRRRMFVAARCRAAEEFTWERRGADLNALYREIAAPAAP